MTTTGATSESNTMPRVDLIGPWPEGFDALRAFDGAVRNIDLETSLVDLVKHRASQVNGCAYCLDVHAKDAREHGESQQRLDVLHAWREVALFSDRERAALALTDAITLVADGHVPDEVVADAQRHFAPTHLAQLVFAIVAVNSWNRIAITGRIPLSPPRD